MNIIAYSNFSKRKNSTKQPSGGTTISVNLKDPTNNIAPVFLLNSATLPNYTYVQAFGKYYFVESITSVSATHYELSCTLDPMATYKSAIGAATCYIERAQGIDLTVPFMDPMRVPYPQLNSPHNFTFSESTSIWAEENTIGSYLMKVTGPSNTIDFGVTTYHMSLLQVAEAIQWAFTEDNMTDLLSDSLTKTYFNPFQYILSLRWCPFTVGNIPAVTDTVKYGWWNTGVSANLVNSQSALVRFSLSMSDFKSTYDWTDPAMYSQYTSYSLYLPGIGVIELSPSDIRSAATQGVLLIDYMVDIPTGETLAKIYVNANNTITYASGNVYVDVQLSQNASNAMEAAGSIASGVSSLLKFDVGGFISSIDSAAKQLMQPTPMNLGTSGNRSSIANMPLPILMVRPTRLTASPSDLFGIPVHQQLQISTLGPYIKTLQANITSAAYGSVKDEINSIMDGGFYYE